MGKTSDGRTSVVDGTSLKSPDRPIVRWGKAIVGATLLVIVLSLFDYALGVPETLHSKFWGYWMIFLIFIAGSLHGSRGKWIL